jgi:hypothetical protein
MQSNNKHNKTERTEGRRMVSVSRAMFACAVSTGFLRTWRR